MPREYRLTFRLDEALYTQLATCGTPGQPVAAIVRQALMEYVARQPERPQPPADVATMLAALARRLEALEEQVQALTARMDGLAAPTRQTLTDVADTVRQTTSAMADTIRQPLAAMAATEAPAPRRPGRPSGPLRQQILALLQAHPEGLSAAAIRVHVQAQRPIGDTLQGMVTGGVIRAQGRGPARRYVLAG